MDEPKESVVATSSGRSGTSNPKRDTAVAIIREIFKTIPEPISLKCESEPELAHLSDYLMHLFTIISTTVYELMKVPTGEPIVPEESARMKRYLNVFEDYCDDRLNCGHWKDVPIIWRKLYAYSELFMVGLYAIDSDRSIPELIAMCDQGLLMGAPILDNILSKIAEQLNPLCEPLDLSESMSKKLKYDKEIPDDFQIESVPEFIRFPDSEFKTPIENKPSLEKFAKTYFSPQQPVVLTGIIDHWPAMEKWCPEYIIKVGGNRTVPIEIGPKYTSEDWTQNLMTLNQFGEQYMSENAKDKGPIGYLAQHQLFCQIPELMQDIREPDYCCLGEDPNVDINAWFGPEGTFTPIHHDPNHNFLAQVFGVKIVRLFPASENENLYPNTQDELLFNSSLVEFDEGKDGICAKFPKYQNAKYTDIILRPGSVLYIPPKWWHMVKALTPSFSVSFWFN